MAILFTVRDAGQGSNPPASAPQPSSPPEPLSPQAWPAEWSPASRPALALPCCPSSQSDPAKMLSEITPLCCSEPCGSPISLRKSQSPHPASRAACSPSTTLFQWRRPPGCCSGAPGARLFQGLCTSSFLLPEPPALESYMICSFRPLLNCHLHSDTSPRSPSPTVSITLSCFIFLRRTYSLLMHCDHPAYLFCSHLPFLSRM